MSISTQKAAYVVAKINNTDLTLIENGQKLVPIKPVCEILGVDAKAQRNRIDRDPILSSVGVIMTSTGADGKQYEMVCLPLKFVFGWLFTIHPDRVSPDAREAVIRYKLQCYDALYRHFSEYYDFVEYRNRLMHEKMEFMNQVREEFRTAKERLDEAKATLQQVAGLTYQEYKALNLQMQLPFNQVMEGGM